MRDDDLPVEMQSLLAALVEQVRAMAARMAGDPERETACHFCGSDVPLWESLVVLQLAGVPAHVECPQDALATKLREAGPLPEFPYSDFSSAIDARMNQARETGADPSPASGDIGS